MFKRVTVRNFRAITDLSVDGLSRVNLFVGHNACGKTSLLESIFFLIGATNPRLPVSVNTFRGFPYVSLALWSTYFHNMDVTVPVEIRGNETDSGDEQRLVIRPRYEHPRSDTEVSSPALSGGWVRTVSTAVGNINGLELEYSTSSDLSPVVSRVFVKGGEVMEEGARVRLPTGAFVLPMEKDLRDRFSEIQRKKQVADVISLLREIEPAIADLRLLDPPGVLHGDVGAPELVPVNLMGGGMMKLLTTGLMMLTLQDGYVLIDEIENGLDYSSQRKLWDAIFSWSQKLNIQVFASTHSVECIRAFSDRAEGELFEVDAKLFRIERNESKFRAVEYTRELLAESLDSNWEVR
ncbi:MAG TPA: AAA family ATPase [Sedimentisphaerales bacterium]|jgi:energy-coupling factor transporter ATP-binding protein EcfA2|nr:AAA family ATPase [Sedimentisphaerales bacterium]HNU28467.1 AAA family ATPase [Sedimentisphaerales bacterium]